MSMSALRKVSPPSDATEQICALFKPFAFSAAMAGLLEGQSPGWIFADHPTAPTVAIASAAEGVFLTGRTDVPEVQDAVERFFQQELLTSNLLVKSPAAIYLSVRPHSWAPAVCTTPARSVGFAGRDILLQPILTRSQECTRQSNVEVHDPAATHQDTRREPLGS